jgi:predicted Fe-S protein YdhL (DUF1289 family)
MTEQPCVGICIMDGDICIGCGRSSEEIYQAGAAAMEEEAQPAEGSPHTLTPNPSPT